MARSCRSRSVAAVGMLRCCDADGCETLTLGRLCVEHESPGRPPERRSARGAVINALAPARGIHNGDACSSDDPRFPWLIRLCVGYRVVTPSGRAGDVAQVVLDEHDRPVGVLVRTGHFRRRVVEIPISELDWIMPSGRRIAITHPIAVTR